MKRPSGAAERHERGCIAVNVKMELRVIPPRHPLRASLCASARFSARATAGGKWVEMKS